MTARQPYAAQPSATPPVADLDRVLEVAEGAMRALHGTRLLVTGGTGFVGRWLLETLAHARTRTGLDVRPVVLTRDPDGFAARVPHLAPGLELLEGDVRQLTAARLGRVDAAVHAATPTDAAGNAADPTALVDVTIDGTRAVLTALAPSGTVPVLHTSSGAVYGPQPPELAVLAESYGGGPDPTSPTAAYAEAKRAAELLGTLATASGGPQVVQARLFAFVGPFLPLDTHFAVGNFIRDALAGGPVVVRGDGRTVRSYLHGADLAAWLWTLLVRGSAGRPYNVGSDDGRTLAEVAALVARAGAGAAGRVQIAGRPTPVSRYVPDVGRVREELGLSVTIDLEDAVTRSLHWARAQH